MRARNTIQRELVLHAAHCLNHPTADEIYAHVAKEHPAISRGTVYRNLGVLVDQGKLRRIAVPESADHFDPTLHAHYHIRCRICGRVDDVDLPYQAKLVENIPNPGGFRVEGHDILLRGVCPGCLSLARTS